MLEIEIKARVTEPQALQREAALQGELLREYHKRDSYFCTPAGPHVRVRREADGSGLVTRKYKQISGGVETSREDEFTVDRPELAEQLLRDLGAATWITKEKRGSAYRIQGLTVEISEVTGLGWFVEIEWLGPDSGEDGRREARQRVVALAADLGIAPDQFEERPYTQLLSEREG